MPDAAAATEEEPGWWWWARPPRAARRGQARAGGCGALRSLQRHARSMFGGCHIATVDGAYAPRGPDGKYHVWYHAGAAGITCQLTRSADPSPLTVGNMAYIAYDGDDNRPGAGTHAAIGMGVASLGGAAGP